MTVTSAQVGAAMNAVVSYYKLQEGVTADPMSMDYQALRAALEGFESAEIARLTLERDHAESVCQEWIKRAEAAEKALTEARHDREIPTSENAYTGIPDSDLGGQS